MVQNVPALWRIPVEATNCLRLFQTCFLHSTHWLLPPVTIPVAQTKRTSVNFCRMRPPECSGTIKLDTTGIPPLCFRFLSSKANALSRWVKLESCMSISFPRNWKLTHYVQDWFDFFFFKCWQVKSSQCKKSTGFTRACSFLVHLATALVLSKAFCGCVDNASTRRQTRIFFLRPNRCRSCQFNARIAGKHFWKSNDLGWSRHYWASVKLCFQTTSSLSPTFHPAPKFSSVSRSSRNYDPSGLPLGDPDFFLNRLTFRINTNWFVVSAIIRS